MERTESPSADATSFVTDSSAMGGMWEMSEPRRGERTVLTQPHVADHACELVRPSVRACTGALERATLTGLESSWEVCPYTKRYQTLVMNQPRRTRKGL